MTIYELNQSFSNLMEVLENTEDQVTKDLVKDSLEQLQLQTTEKVENIIKYIKNLESEAKALDEESKRLAERKKTTLKKVDNLKQYLKDFTGSLEGKKYNAGIFKLSIRKNAPSVNVVDIKAIPKNFIKTEVVETVDKMEIKKALKNGEIIEGVELISSESISIK